MVLPIVLQAKNSTREMLFSQQFWIGLPLYLTKKYMCKKYNQFPSEFVCSIGCLISQSPTPKKMNPYTTPEMNVSLNSKNIDFLWNYLVCQKLWLPWGWAHHRHYPSGLWRIFQTLLGLGCLSAIGTYFTASFDLRLGVGDKSFFSISIIFR